MFIPRVLLPLIIHNVVRVFGQNDNSMVTEGEFQIVSTDFCDEKYEMTLDVKQRKHNRTVEVFNIEMNLTRTVDKSLGIRLDIDKCVDGGCKPYQVLSDDDFPHFCYKFGENVTNDILGLLEMDSFSIPEGSYKLNNYILDKCALPRKCVEGRYKVRAVLLAGDKEIACIKATVDFVEYDESPCEDNQGEED